MKKLNLYDVHEMSSTEMKNHNAGWGGALLFGALLSGCLLYVLFMEYISK
mgnify:CR=1 FL=1